jgi:hypothetical protein
VGLGRGPLSLMRIIKELLEWKGSGSGQENRINRSVALTTTLYPQKLALTSPTSGGRSVDIVRLRTKGDGFFFIMSFLKHQALDALISNTADAYFFFCKEKVAIFIDGNWHNFFLNK